jgi:hypothetical protein
MRKVVRLNEFGSSLAARKNRPLGDRRLARAVDPEVPERPRRRKFMRQRVSFPPSEGHVYDFAHVPPLHPGSGKPKGGT